MQAPFVVAMNRRLSIAFDHFLLGLLAARLHSVRLLGIDAP